MIMAGVRCSEIAALSACRNKSLLINVTSVAFYEYVHSFLMFLTLIMVSFAPSLWPVKSTTKLRHVKNTRHVMTHLFWCKLTTPLEIMFASYASSPNIQPGA